ADRHVRSPGKRRAGHTRRILTPPRRDRRRRGLQNLTCQTPVLGLRSDMEAQVWTLIGLLGAALFGLMTALFNLGGRIDALGVKIDRLTERITALQGRFDVLEARFDDHVRRHTG